MQNFCDSRFYPTARSSSEGSRRAESIAHHFVAQRRFSTLVSWSGSSFIRRGLEPLHRLQVEVTRGVPFPPEHRWDGNAEPRRSKCRGRPTAYVLGFAASS
jgi:hypothetical protein